MSETALLLLDLQNEMVSPEGKVGAGGLAKIVSEQGILRNAAQLLADFRSRGQPVMHVRVGFREDYADTLSVAPRIAKLKESKGLIAGGWGTEFPAEVAPLPTELVFTKQCVNPFFNTGLLSALMKRGVDHVVLGGVVTNLVVESTARYADDAGLRVTVVHDCCTAPNPAWHRFSVENMLPLFGRVTSTEELLKERRESRSDGRK